MFSPDFIERVRDANDLVELISQHVQLKKSGQGLTGLCPFHNEKSPSFSVSDTKQVYHCFGCGASGNIYSFLKDFKGMTFPESVEFLANRSGIPIPQDQNFKKDTRKVERSKLLARVNQLAARFFQDNISKGQNSQVQQYLRGRGLSPEVCEKLGLGYAPADWSRLADLMKAKNVPLEAAASLGLIKARKSGEGYFDLFRDRVMFPIQSPMGEVIGFGGRVLDPEQNPKYLNSPESDLFHKGRVFYGLNESAKHIRAQDEAIVVEGYMDYLALFERGILNVVATLGTALTSDHARLIKRYTKNVNLLFDGDKAGQTAAQRSLPILLEAGISVKALFLPGGLDPDDFLKKEGPEALKKELNESKDLFVSLMRDDFKAAGTSPADRLRFIDQIAPIFKSVADPRLRQLYEQWFADMFGSQAEWALTSLKQAIDGAGASRSSAASVPRTSTDSRGGARPVDQASPQGADQSSAGETEKLRDIRELKVSGAAVYELELVNIALMKKEYFERVMESGIESAFSQSGMGEVLRRAIELYRHSPSKFDNLTALLIDEVRPSTAVTMHLRAPLSGLGSAEAKKLIEDCMHRIQEKKLRDQTMQLKAHLKGAGSESERREQLEQIMNIQNERRALKQKNEEKNQEI